MRREDLLDMSSFLAVAEERSFTRAAARLGITQSTISYSIRGFEERLGVRLFNRTTRSVALTDAGERLLASAGPALETLNLELAALSELRGKPAGSARITTSAHAYHTLVWPTLTRLMPSHPGIHVEVSIEHRFIDIVAERFDAGIRLGEAVERDMIAVRIGPELRWIVVGSPGYLTGRTVPATPQSLTDHDCVNYRNTAAGDLYAWEFEKDGRDLSVRVDGPLAFNDVYPAVEAAVQGLGLAYVPEDIATESLREGKLVQVLEDWCPPSPGYYLYYPSRRQMPPAITVLVNALKWRGAPQS